MIIFNNLSILKCIAFSHFRQNLICPIGASNPLGSVPHCALPSDGIIVCLCSRVDVTMKIKAAPSTTRPMPDLTGKGAITSCVARVDYATAMHFWVAGRVGIGGNCMFLKSYTQPGSPFCAIPIRNLTSMRLAKVSGVPYLSSVPRLRKLISLSVGNLISSEVGDESRGGVVPLLCGLQMGAVFTSRL